MQTVEAWREAYERRLGSASEARRIAAAPPVALLLAYDAARLVSEAALRLSLPAMAGAECARGAGAFHADTLLNYLRSEDWGHISWEADGARREVQLVISELARGGALQAAGDWAARGGLRWTRRPHPAPPPPRHSMTNRTFNVLIAIVRTSPHSLTGGAGACAGRANRFSQTWRCPHWMRHESWSHWTLTGSFHEAAQSCHGDPTAGLVVDTLQ
ncbi:hypothetical protein evm_015354 [Chilo suppressalis]|nr:hypothetical protein evm_015354 [Chilo suppressalis]